MMKRLFWTVCALGGIVGKHGPLCAETSEEECRRRIYSHLLISDWAEAQKEAESAVQIFPHSVPLQTAYLQTLCMQGEEAQALQLWSQIPHSCLTDPLNRKRLELLAWGVLKKGESSEQISIRLNSMLGSAFTGDAKAIPFIQTQLHSSNALLRSIAIRLAASYGDAPLKEEIVRLLKEEKVWYVRLEAIAAAGAMRLYDQKSTLKEIVANPHTLLEEKTTAILALVGMYDRIDAEELQGLITSERAGLRQLAAELIAHLQLKESATSLLPLLRDSCPDVRVSALNALALLRLQQVGSHSLLSLLEPQLKETSPPVAITAAYVLLVNKYKEGEEILGQWMQSEFPQWRRLASAAVAASGKQGLALAQKGFVQTQDPYVKMNVARALMGHKAYRLKAAETIHAILAQEKNTLWMWEQEANPLFRSLAPSEVRHLDFIPNYPAVVDQRVRLDFLSMLSIVRYAKAKEAVREFLQNRSWGVTGAAAATLLQEGGEEDLAAVRELLKDPDEHIRCQAALILALVGSDPSAVSVLQEAYAHVDREIKIHILEALAHIGDPSSIPFLEALLRESSQVLRVVAASALIQCLYH